jgi:aminomethyltransferase
LNGPNTKTWDIFDGNEKIGHVTSAVYSPRLKQNIALAMVNISYTDINTHLKVKINTNLINAVVTEKPFFDPNKLIAKEKTN